MYCYVLFVRNSDKIAIFKVLNGKKSQAGAFGALSLSGFSTKPDAVRLITRRHDISNECRGKDCTAMCCLCVIATNSDFQGIKHFGKKKPSGRLWRPISQRFLNQT